MSETLSYVSPFSAINLSAALFIAVLNAEERLYRAKSAATVRSLISIKTVNADKAVTAASKSASVRFNLSFLLLIALKINQRLS